MSREIFRRKEQKYILTDTQRQAMEALLREYMQPDRYGCSTVCSLYLDTPDYRLIRRSLSRSQLPGANCLSQAISRRCWALDMRRS